MSYPMWRFQGHNSTDNTDIDVVFSTSDQIYNSVLIELNGKEWNGTISRVDVELVP